MPLALGLVPEDMKAKVLDVLIKDIEAHDYHLTTGIFGTKYLFQALSNAGRDDIAYRIANQRTFPGWGFMLEKGATTLWEHWEFSDNTFSHNHPMFGSVSEWFYKSLAGIQPDPSGPGFKKFFIKPSIVGDLTWVKCHHDSMYGRIESSWRRHEDKLILNVTVPPNTTATVTIPGTNIIESGNLVGAKLLRTEGKSSIFEIGSGSYRFESSL
jgi:alpha-L-rhamnosidase